jgi:hypothetical protein
MWHRPKKDRRNLDRKIEECPECHFGRVTVTLWVESGFYYRCDRCEYLWVDRKPGAGPPDTGWLASATAFFVALLIGICAGSFLVVVEDIETFITKHPAAHQNLVQ